MIIDQDPKIDIWFLNLKILNYLSRFFIWRWLIISEIDMIFESQDNQISRNLWQMMIIDQDPYIDMIFESQDIQWSINILHIKMIDNIGDRYMIFESQDNQISRTLWQIYIIDQYS